jgi:hypothetical protein
MNDRQRSIPGSNNSNLWIAILALHPIDLFIKTRAGAGHFVVSAGTSRPADRCVPCWLQLPVEACHPVGFAFNAGWSARVNGTITKAVVAADKIPTVRLE